MEYKKKFKVSEICPGVKPTETSHEEIMKMVSSVRRPYCPDDFKKQYFIPDLKETKQR